MSVDTCPICETAIASGLQCCPTCGYNLEDDLWASRKEREQMRRDALEQWSQRQEQAEVVQVMDAPEITVQEPAPVQPPEVVIAPTLSKPDVAIPSTPQRRENAATLAVQPNKKEKSFFWQL